MSQQDTESMEIVTCSYRPDVDRCRRLCLSIDRHVPDGIGHVLILPARDLALFRPRAGGRRTVIAAEEVLPQRLVQLPWGEKFWVDSRGWPVRGSP